MPGIVEVVSNLVRPYYYYIVAIISVVIIGYVANYAYNTYYKKRLQISFRT